MLSAIQLTFGMGWVGGVGRTVLLLLLSIYIPQRGKDPLLIHLRVFDPVATTVSAVHFARGERGKEECRRCEACVPDKTAWVGGVAGGVWLAD